MFVISELIVFFKGFKIVTYFLGISVCDHRVVSNISVGLKRFRKIIYWLLFDFKYTNELRTEQCFPTICTLSPLQLNITRYTL